MKGILAIILSICMLIPLAIKAEEAKMKEHPGGKKIEKELIVGCVWASPIGDMGWTYSHDLGRQYLEKELPYVSTLIEENVSPPDAPAVVEIMIKEGADVLLLNDIFFQDVAMEKGKKYPDKYFVYCAGPKTSENVASIFSAMYEARYLTGILAGALTKTGKIGYVAAVPLPQVIRGINAMELGARAVNPDAKVHVIYTNSWYDPPTERDVANTLIGLGCDFIAQQQNTPSPVQAAGEKGVYSSGFHSDMTKFAPEKHVCASIWNWGPIYKRIVEAYANGTPLKNASIWGTMADGSVDISPINPAIPIPEKILNLVEQRRKELKDGTFHVFEGPIRDRDGEIRVPKGQVLSYEDLRKMNWYVDGVIAPKK